MRKTIIVTLIIFFFVSIVAAIFSKNQLATTWLIFTVINLCIICIIWFSLRNDRRMTQQEEVSKQLSEKNKKEILEICEKETISHLYELVPELQKAMMQDSINDILEWNNQIIPKFLNSDIIPVIQESIPMIDSTTVKTLEDDMRLMVFKITYDKINESEKQEHQT